MLRFILIFILLFKMLFASSNIDSLLQEYEETSKNSLQTLNEKMGHARIYSQNDLKAMQYDRLSEILKELPITSLNKSSFGANTLSLVGTKSETSGYFRLFINDHEVSSAYTQSPFLSWYELPVSLIDYIEIYMGEGSFTLGNETGVEFIRVYTKKPSKENGGNLKTTISNNSNNSQEFSYSSMLENGWSYLLYFANQNSFFDRFNKNDLLDNDTSQKYLFLDIGNDKNKINLGYTKLEKENYQGMSYDANSDDGKIKSTNFFINYNRYFLDDDSLKLNLSADVENRIFEEQNKEAIGVVGIPGYLGRFITKFDDDSKFTKLNATLSKNFKTEKNNLFTSLSFSSKDYDVNSRAVNNIPRFNYGNQFNKERSYSLAIQDDYKLLDNLIIIGNFKVNNYQRNGFMIDNTENLYRIGAIYLPTTNLGFKTFYTMSHIPPSFYNIDSAFMQRPTLDSQKYDYFTFEGAYTFEKSRLSVEYFNVHMTDYIYFAHPIGFINVDHKIKTNGFIFDYTYNFDKKSKLDFNYFYSQLTEEQSNYTDGGYLKYTKSFDKTSYFASLIFRKGFSYLGLDIKNSYNLNIGATHSFTKNFSVSVKGTNLLNKPTQSILSDYTAGYGNPTLSLIDDYDRAISFSLNWRF
ncbi:TonB-dependent receptor plug domain-containing protein [Campylobacterota bacterium DY0563]